MRFIRKKKRAIVIQIIPMMDILTILLIFFVVTTTWKKKLSKVNIKLPSAQKSNLAKKEKNEKVTVMLTRDGEIFFEEKKYTANEITQILKSLKQKNDKLQIQIESDKDATFQMFIDLWINLKNANLKGFHIKYQNKN